MIYNITITGQKEGIRTSILIFILIEGWFTVRKFTKEKKWKGNTKRAFF